ncbi:MAG: hypothetical protein SGARI_006742, partial [Bacillariaceae sp.]
AFTICDADGSGAIDKRELYAGLLLVHLNLAKYAGPAACYPPTRATCNLMFEAADVDQSGSIDHAEFCHIMAVLCAQIMGRIVVYYIVLILLVPVVATKIVNLTGIVQDSYLELTVHQATSLALFFVIIPLVWNKIDERSTQQLQTKKSSSVGSYDVKDLELSSNLMESSDDEGGLSKRSNIPTSGRSLL